MHLIQSFSNNYIDWTLYCEIAQLAGAVEYTNCFSTEGYEPPP